MSGPYSYHARVWSAAGVLTTHLVEGQTAGCALTRIRRERCGDWSRIEVGYGRGAEFVALREAEK